jgi:PIN domain nuclease of toxin-antitoxin system
VKLLLDTHAFLWWASGDPRLSSRAAGLISDAENDVFFSAASAWEIVIKSGLGRVRLPDAPKRYLPDRMARHGFAVLPVQMRHAIRVHDLPPLHRDPFDRMLVAQALAEDMALLSGDPHVARYPVTVLW